MLLHPQEALLQQARAFQASPAFDDVRRRRQTVEHRRARLIQLGLRQARYVGRAKTLFQLAMAAAVANLTLLVAGAAGLGTAAVALAGTAALLMLLIYRQHPDPVPLPARSRLARCLRSWRHAALIPTLGIVALQQLAASRPHF